MNIERRFVPFAEFRADEKTATIRGHPATFDDTYDLGPFDERIAPGAFDNVMSDDVRALFNHDANQILGRTKTGTLRLSLDKVGLFSEIDLPESATTLREAIARGDIDQMSFGFSVKRDTWEVLDEESGRELRTIEEVGRLFDVSPVTFPANPNTDVALRSLEEFRNGQEEKEGRRSPEMKPCGCGEQRGDALGAFISDNQGDVSNEAIGSAAGISAGTVGKIKNGSIVCPPLARLRAIAGAISVSMSAILAAAGRDGCEYDEEDAADPHWERRRRLEIAEKF